MGKKEHHYVLMRCKKSDHADKFFIDDGDFCLYTESKKRNELLQQQLDDWDGYPRRY